MPAAVRSRDRSKVLWSPETITRISFIGCSVIEVMRSVPFQGSWAVPPIFDEIQRLGDVADDEMAKVFNLGIGMLAVVPAHDVFHALDLLRGRGHEAVQVGEIVRGDGRVHVE